MFRKSILATLFGALILCSLSAAGPAKLKATECYVVAEEGASQEATKLFLSRMGTDTELFRSSAPSRFTLKGNAFSVEAKGSLVYEAEAPVLVEKKGRFALYEVKVRFASPVAEKAKKKVDVDFTLADLAERGGVQQPGVYVIEKAARKAGWESGLAWVVKMKRLKDGKLRATVALAR
jgi:hypothetical protein